MGKTGSGKTNLLQLVGMTEKMRMDAKDTEESYFLLYRSTSCPDEYYNIELFNCKPPLVNDVAVPEFLYKKNSIFALTNRYERHKDEAVENLFGPQDPDVKKKEFRQKMLKDLTGY